MEESTRPHQEPSHQGPSQQPGYQPAAPQQPAYRPSQTGYQAQGAPQGAYQQQAAPAARPAGEYAYRQAADYAQAAQAQAQPQPQAAGPQRAAYASPAQPGQPSGKQPRQGGAASLLKTCAAGFVGALIAVLIVLGATGNLVPADSGSASGGTQSLGGSGGTSITVSGDDVTLPEAVAAKTLPSVVCIYVYSAANTGYGWIGGTSTEETLSSLGSGVVISDEGHIITNYHVIEGESSLKVSMNGEQYDATLVGSDPSSDLAVIKVEGASDITPIEIGSSSDLVVGEWVMTVGAPYGMEQSVGSGIVSAVSRSSASLQQGEGSAVYANLIQTDAPINPGNSGGALVDSDGKLVGINTLTASYSGSNSGVGFAIPVDYAASIANQIINGEEPSHAQLGVSLITIDASTARRYNLSADAGAYVSRVYSGAAEAGIQEGDIITKIDGRAMTSATDVILAIRSHMPGDTVSVEVNRNGELVAMDVVLSSDNVS